MFSVIKLGGVNGSGKTTLARSILHLTNAKPVVTGRSEAHSLGSYNGTPVYILGRYETACGGMDTISDKHDRLSLVQRLCRPGRIIFFEGLITGKTYGKFGEMSEKHVKAGRGVWHYVFMDTPYEECVRRVMERRAARGNDNPFDPERTMRSTYKSCVTLEQKLRNNELYPHPTHTIDHKTHPDRAAADLLTKVHKFGGHNARR